MTTATATLREMNEIYQRHLKDVIAETSTLSTAKILADKYRPNHGYMHISDLREMEAKSRMRAELANR